MIPIRARFHQIVPPQARIEFSVDLYNLFLSRALDRETRPLSRLNVRSFIVPCQPIKYQ